MQGAAGQEQKFLVLLSTGLGETLLLPAAEVLLGGEAPAGPPSWVFAPKQAERTEQPVLRPEDEAAGRDILPHTVRLASAPSDLPFMAGRSWRACFKENLCLFSCRGIIPCRLFCSAF